MVRTCMVQVMKKKFKVRETPWPPMTIQQHMKIEAMMKEKYGPDILKRIAVENGEFSEEEVQG